MTTIEREPRRGDAAVLRRIWRLHFWVGVFAAPALVVLACSGLVILYSQPLDLWLNRGLTVVSAGSAPVSLDDQVAEARRQAGPGLELDAVTPPAAPDRATRVDFVSAGIPGAGERNVTQVFVDPYSGRYLGQRHELDGLVGWANQVHRLFGNDGPTLSLPSLGHLLAPDSHPEPSLRVGIGNLLIEMIAVWVLVLAASGLYLWWPRALERGKPRLRIRWRKGGRIRWRDVHAATGALLSVVLICYIVSGLTWSRYWGENWRAFTAAVTPSTEIDAPSTPATMGDLDRLGRRIAWADKDDPVYASTAAAAADSAVGSAPPGWSPKPLGFNDINEIARAERMVPGYAIVPPSDSTGADGTVYGSYAVVNHWPQRLSEQRTLHLDQFTGQTIANATAGQDGALSRATGWAVDMHMGTQYGIVTRVLATAACLGLLTSIATAAAMWWKRRPAGGSGLPGRAGDPPRPAAPRGTTVAVGVIATTLAVVYPSFGVTLLLVLVAEAVLAARRNRVSPGAV